MIPNSEGIRSRPGAHVFDGRGSIVFTPLQEEGAIMRSLRDLVFFINHDQAMDVDPLVKMALIRHRFEAIHPFYDGSGRTGRILNVLFLVQTGLLRSPILCLSRPILRNKQLYYELLQDVRDRDRWEKWVEANLLWVAMASLEGRALVARIRGAYEESKVHLRVRHRFSSPELLDHLFSHPCTRIEFIQRDFGVSRLTASKWLAEMADSGQLARVKAGRSLYFLNSPLWKALTEEVGPMAAEKEDGPELSQ